MLAAATSLLDSTWTRGLGEARLCGCEEAGRGAYRGALPSPGVILCHRFQPAALGGAVLSISPAPGREGPRAGGGAGQGGRDLELGRGRGPELGAGQGGARSWGRGAGDTPPQVRPALEGLASQAVRHRQV